MLVETAGDFYRLRDALGAGGAALRLALDTGHCLVTGDRDPAEAVRECAADLGTVAVEDMRRGVHEHLPFGEGDMDAAAVLRALADPDREPAKLYKAMAENRCGPGGARHEEIASAGAAPSSSA